MIDNLASIREEGYLSEADIFFYSSAYGMTAALADKLPFKAERVKGSYRAKKSTPIVAAKNFVLLVPTYKTESDRNYIPRCLKEFLMTYDNSKSMVGVVGIGNVSFGSDYNKAADIISDKFDVPVLGKVELSGTQDDVIQLTESISNALNKDNGLSRKSF